MSVLKLDTATEFSEKIVKHFPLVLIVVSCFIMIQAATVAVAQRSLNPPQPKIDLTEDELVHFGDVIDVDVVGGFEFDWRGTLTAEGFLDGLDGFNEPVFGLCRTELQIADEITKIYSKILRDPKVVVKIIDRSNRAVVRLDGAVRTATRFRLQREIFLRELIVLAGGIISGASGDISIFRPNNLNCRGLAVRISDTVSIGETGAKDNGNLNIDIKISELLSGNYDANPQILSGDIVTVHRALPIYVIGAVNSPRPIYSRDKMTLTRLISSAGGLSKNADPSRIFVYRRLGSDVQSIETDLSKIKSGKSDDEILLPFDIIEVAAKGGGKRKYPPMVAKDENREKRDKEFPLRIVD